MMSQEANDLITRTGAKDPCGKLMRHVLAAGGAGRRVAGPARGAAGETARREAGAVSRRTRPLRPDRSPLRASRRRPRLRPSRKRRLALRLPWLAVRRLRPVHRDAGGAERLETVPGHQAARLSRGREERHPLGLSGRRRTAGISRRSTASSRPTAIRSRSRATSTATGCRRWKSASIRRTPRSCIASSRTRTRRPPTASSSAAPPPAPTCR